MFSALSITGFSLVSRYLALILTHQELSWGSNPDSMLSPAFTEGSEGSQLPRTGPGVLSPLES